MESLRQDGLATEPDPRIGRYDPDLEADAPRELAVPGTAQRVNEASAVLIGRCSSRGWSGRLVQSQDGDPASVEFDWAWVLGREEEEGDVIGFHHTHPGGPAVPSSRDVRTMRAWVSCLGKPLLCLIETGPMLCAYLFETDEDDGQPLSGVQRQGGKLAVSRL